MRSLTEEYETKRVIYKQQKKYRKTRDGKEALAKANKKYRVKQRLQKLYDISNNPECYICRESVLGFLIAENSSIMCFNCKFGMTEEEIKECQ